MTEFMIQGFYLKSDKTLKVVISENRPGAYRYKYSLQSEETGETITLHYTDVVSLIEKKELPEYVNQ